MGRNVVETLAFAFWCLAYSFLALRIQILMLFEAMIAKTFSLWSNHLALNLVTIAPT